MATDHMAYANALRRRVTEGTALTSPGLREKIVSRVAGGSPIEEPFENLVEQIAVAADQVTDQQVAAIRATTGSDKAAFEIVMTATIAAGITRWDQAIKVLKQASDAAG